ncbi:MAG TPA: hypothetical protein VIS75_04590, partial [Chitinophagaceae bacterium]
VRMRDRRSRLRRARIDMDYNDWFEYRTNVDYVMTDKGTLVDPNKPAETTSAPKSQTDDYRYDDRQSLKDSIDAREKRLEDDRKRLDEDKKRLQRDSTQGNGKKEGLDDEDDNEDVAGSPIFSLVQIFN